MPQTKHELIAARVTGQEKQNAQDIAYLLDISESEFVRRAVAHYIAHLADADARKVEEAK
jgi:putative heme degradation protein